MGVPVICHTHPFSRPWNNEQPISSRAMDRGPTCPSAFCHEAAHSALIAALGARCTRAACAPPVAVPRTRQLLRRCSTRTPNTPRTSGAIPGRGSASPGGAACLGRVGGVLFGSGAAQTLPKGAHAGSCLDGVSGEGAAGKASLRSPSWAITLRTTRTPADFSLRRLPGMRGCAGRSLAPLLELYMPGCV